MEILTFILGAFTLVGILGTIAASFYAVKQKTTIEILNESNKAYSERNIQLEALLAHSRQDSVIKTNELMARVKLLEQMKTPPMKPLMDMVKSIHLKVVGRSKVRPR